MDNLWLFADALALYVPSALYVPVVVILLLCFSAYIIEKLISDQPNHNVQRPTKMNSGDVKNWHRSEANGRLQSIYTTRSRSKLS